LFATSLSKQKALSVKDAQMPIDAGVLGIWKKLQRGNPFSKINLLFRFLLVSLPF
jgi:hypothetical protein